MKTSTLLTAGLLLLLASRSLSVSAADPRIGTSYNATPNRGLFGLPMPQQWSGARPTGYNGAGYTQGGYSANCPNGNCQTGGYGVQTGYRGQTGNCANGQCATGACASGQCATGNCPNGQCVTGNCPNGNCAATGYSGNRLPQGAQSGWSPRSSRSGLADPYRRSGDYSDRNEWTQRAQRPVLDPLNDTLNSRYRRDELELRNDYFGNQSGSGYDHRTQSRSPLRTNSNEWDRPSGRSMEAPSNGHNGVARF